MEKNEILGLLSNTIRGLTLDAVNKAQSGHIGLPLGCADITTILYTEMLKHYPKDPLWIDRDRFVLSAGHGSMLLYSILHLTGYDISIEDIKNFRQLNSKTPGHPEYNETPGVEVTSGPLGQGVSNAVGMAIAERMLAEKFNTEKHKIIDHYTYCLAGDGCLMEGVSAEAISLAGHLGLNKLILIYDDNNITIDGSTNISYSDNVPKRFESYNWSTQIIDGHNVNAVMEAIKKAKEVTDKPSVIIARTIPGKELDKYEGSYKSHGYPMNSDDVDSFRKKFKFPYPFYVADEIIKYKEDLQTKLKTKYDEWNNIFDEWKKENPDLFLKFNKALKGHINHSDELLTKQLVNFEFGKKIATRNASGDVINAIASNVDFLIGGSADLAGSTNTTINGSEFISNGKFNGKNIHFGVREHSMGGILNGLSLHKGFRPYGSTFLVFSDYMRPSIRLAALMKLPVVYIFTHDSFQVGEDGPTHQPIEHIQSLRNIPNLIVIRPCDALEVEEAWKFILTNNDNPVALILTRQKVVTIDRNNYGDAKGLQYGAYIIKDTDTDPDLIIIATGSEVNTSIESANLIEEKHNAKVRVISIPSFEIFDKQPDSYKDKILPKNIKKRISIEAGVTSGWFKYIGSDGLTIGIDRFGASAPADSLIDYFGFKPEKIVKKITTFYAIE